MHPLAFIAGWMLLGVLFAVQEYAGMRVATGAGNLKLELLGWVAHFFLWGCISLAFWILWRKGIESVSGWALAYLVFPLSVAVGALEEVGFVGLLAIAMPRHAKTSFGHRLVYTLDSELISNIVLFWLVFVLFRAFIYYKTLQERESSNARIKTELARAQLHALQMQLNPHFLFNAMNMVSSLMRTDVDAADKMLERLSDLLRMTLERGEAAKVSLSDEVDFLEMYVSIQAVRFGGRVKHQVDISPEVRRASVPSMILQPIVENAYVHGIAKTTGQARLLIEGRNQNGRLSLRVVNTAGAPLSRHDSATSAGGIGLANVRARLTLHYGDSQSLQLCENANGEVEVVLILPLQMTVRSKNEWFGIGQ